MTRIRLEVSVLQKPNFEKNIDIHAIQERSEKTTLIFIPS